MMQWDKHLFLFVTEIAFKMRARIIVFFRCVKSRMSTETYEPTENGIINCDQTNFKCIFSYPVAFSRDTTVMAHETFKQKNEMSYETERLVITPTGRRFRLSLIPAQQTKFIALPLGPIWYFFQLSNDDLFIACISFRF